ncbi:hypothetical protein PYCC9005_002402 [Savitreella phatthalungensis]
MSQSGIGQPLSSAPGDSGVTSAASAGIHGAAERLFAGKHEDALTSGNGNQIHGSSTAPSSGTVATSSTPSGGALAGAAGTSGSSAGIVERDSQAPKLGSGSGDYKGLGASQSTADDLKSKLPDNANQAHAQAKDAVNQTKEKVGEYVNDEKDAGAHGLTGERGVAHGVKSGLLMEKEQGGSVAGKGGLHDTTDALKAKLAQEGVNLTQ